MFSSVSSFGLTGIACYPVTVEADVSRAFPCFEIVGRPDAAVKESKDRVRSAMKNCGMEFPSSRVVVNLAPADTKKTGAIYDLPILVGILCSTGALPALPEGLALVGELSLDGPFATSIVRPSALVGTIVTLLVTERVSVMPLTVTVTVAVPVLDCG